MTRLTLSDSAAAPLTFGFTSYPGLILHAGLLHDFAYPICGCDACDETAVGQVDKSRATFPPLSPAITRRHTHRVRRCRSNLF